MTNAPTESSLEATWEGFGIEIVGDLFTLLDLEKIEENLFRGQSAPTRWQRAFGGQVAAQALVAAGRTVDADRHVHSLHSYFLRPGDSAVPIVYEVDRVRDGRSFTTRRVSAIQHGQTIFVLSASFQLPQSGVEHQSPVPAAPPPQTVPPLAVYHGGVDPFVPVGKQEPVIDLRFVGVPPWLLERQELHSDHRQIWMRVPASLSDDPLMHVCALTFASDLTLMDSVLIRNGLKLGRDVTAVASLDHAMWFLRPVRADEWFLYDYWSPASAGGRGIAHGEFYSEDGQLLALVMQEGMVRVTDQVTDRGL